MRSLLKILFLLLVLTSPLVAQQPNPANPQTPGFTLNSFDTQYLYYNDNAGNLKRTAVTPIQTLGTPQNPCVGTQTAVNVLNNFFYYCYEGTNLALVGTWQLISGGGGGGGSPGGSTNQLQCNGGNSIFSGCNANDTNGLFSITEPLAITGTLSTTGAATLGGLLTVNAAGVLNGDATLKGPNPYVDVRSYGVRGLSNVNAAPAVPGLTATISSGQSTASVSAATCSSQAGGVCFVNGDGVIIYGAGPATTLSTPGTPTVTPSEPRSGSGTADLVASPSGGTTYQYQVVARDKNGGLTAASTAGVTSTGQASLGSQSVAIASATCSGNTVTVTTSSAHTLAVGAQIMITVASGGNSCINGYGTYQVNGSADNTHFTYQQGVLTTNGGATSFSGTATVFWLQANKITWTAVPNTWQYYIYGRTSGSMALIGVTHPSTGTVNDTTFEDYGSTMMASSTLGIPSYVPSAPPVSAQAQPLITTIAAGAGTTNLTLANAATTSVTNATILFTDGPNIISAAAAANNLYWPIGGFYVVNSFTDVVAANINNAWMYAGGLFLNETLTFRGNWEGSKPNTVPGNNTDSFNFVGEPVVTTNANPGVFVANASGFYDRLAFKGGQNPFFFDANTDPSGPQFGQHLYFATSANSIDYMGIALYGRGAAGVQSITGMRTGRINVQTGPGQQGAGFTGSTFTPAVYFSDIGSVTIDALFMQNRGLLFRIDPAGGSFKLNWGYTQGGITPFITASSSGGGNTGGNVEIQHTIADTTFQPTLSYVPSLGTLSAAVLVGNLDQLPTGGTPIITGPTANWSVTGTTSGQNTSAISGPNFTDNTVTVNGTSGSMGYPMNPPVAPVSAVVSAGGNVPVGLTFYAIAATDSVGNLSQVGASISANVTTGNQTVTITPPIPANLPPGTVGLKYFRGNSSNVPFTGLTGVSSNNCGPFSPTATFVDTLGFQACAPPLASQMGRALTNGIGSTGIETTALNLIGGGFTSSETGTFTANRAINVPDVSGTVCVLAGSFTNGDVLQITSVGGVLSCTDAGPGAGGATFKVDGTNTANQVVINFQDGAAFNGLTPTFSNPSAGNVQLGFTGTLGNAGLTHSSVTVNTSSPLSGGGAVSLGNSLTLSCPTCSTAVINTGTANHLAEYTTTGSPATISSDGNLDDGATAANTLTYTGSGGIASPQFATNSPGAFTLAGNEGSAPGGTSLVDIFWASSVVHRWEMNNNNTGIAVVAANPMTTLGDTVYGGTLVSGVPTETRLGIGSTNQVYIVTGGLPSWGLASLTASVTGILPIANGGCNASTAASCITNIMPIPVRTGDVPFWNGSIWTTLAGNNSGTQVLSENASGTPSFISNSVTLNTTSPLAGGGAVALGGSLTFTCPTCDTNLTTANDTSTGTTVNLLAKLTSTGAILTGTGDINIPVFVVVSGAGITGSAVLATGGQVSCVMDATASNTEGFYVIESVTTAGRCHAQSAQPTGVYVAGTLVSNSTTSGSTATVQVLDTFIASGSASGVSSLTGDGTLINNSASFGAVTLTLANAGAHKWWGNASGSTGAPGYNTIGTGDLPGTGATTVNGDTCTLGSTCTVTLDQIGNPAASKTFTEPATDTLTLAGTAPASGSGGGTNAGTLLTLSKVTGGATTGSATTAGTGSQLSFSAGDGGSGSGGTNAIGGAGGSISLTTGNGGASGGTAVNSNGGSLNLVLGSPGTGGSGTVGVGGAFNLSQPVTTAVTNSPQVNLSGEYQNAATPTFAADTWTFQAVIGAGTNGTSTLNLTHSGTSGVATFVLPNLTAATTQSAGDNTTDVATDAFVTTAVANAIAAVNPAVAVLAATTGSNLTGTYTQVGGGIGDTFTVTATGAFTLDGVAINTIGQRVLIKDQSTASQNGVYTATIVGATGISPVFTRALDYDTASDVNNTGIIPVQSGTVNISTSWLLTSQVTSIGSSGSSLTYAQFSLNPTNLVTAAANFTSGDLVQAAASSRATSDSGIATANVVTAASNYTNGDLVQAAASNKTTSDSGVVAANVVTATAAAGSSNQLCTSGGATKTCSYITFPDTKYSPAADCVNAVAGSGWSTGATPAALCRAGTNNKTALLSPWGASDVGYTQFHIPADADLSTQLPSLMLEVTTTESSTHTIIMQESVACAKEDGSTTDDVAFNAARSFTTVTETSKANQVFDTTITLNSTDLTGCAAPGIMWVKISRTTDTATNVGVYGLNLTTYRLLTVQAN